MRRGFDEVSTSRIPYAQEAKGVARILHCGGTEAERRRRENRVAEGAEGVGIREGVFPSPDD